MKKRCFDCEHCQKDFVEYPCNECRIRPGKRYWKKWNYKKENRMKTEVKTCWSCKFEMLTGMNDDPCSGCLKQSAWKPKKEIKMAKNKNNEIFTLPGGGDYKITSIDRYMLDVTKLAKSGHKAKTFTISTDVSGAYFCTCQKTVIDRDCKHIKFVKENFPLCSAKKVKPKTNNADGSPEWKEFETTIKNDHYMFRVVPAYGNFEASIPVFKNHSAIADYSITGPVHDLKCTCLGFKSHQHCKHVDYVKNNGLLKYYDTEHVVELEEAIDVENKDGLVIQTKNATMKIHGNFNLDINEKGETVITLK